MRIIGKLADHGKKKSYVPGCAGDVKTFHTLPIEKCQQAWFMLLNNQIPQQFDSKL